MMPDLLSACARRGVAADVMAVQDESLVLEVEDGSLAGASSRTVSGASLRVFANGAWGWAGATDDAAQVEDLVDTALQSAGSGESVHVHLPAAAPLPAVATADDDTATMPVADLQRVATALTTRLQGRGRRILVTVERTLGEVAVGNTRGVSARHDTTLAAISLLVQASHDDGVVAVRGAIAGVAMPTEADLEAMASEALQQLSWAASPAAPPAGGRVLLLPRALRQVLRPVERALLGDDAALGPSMAGAMGEQRFSPSIFLEDAPWLPGRPGSRPIDDDGVVTRTVRLIDGGVVSRFLCDLVTGARLGRPSTGSARRTLTGPSRPGFSNLILQPGERPTSALIQGLGDGLVVEGLAGGAGAVSASGAFRFPVALGFRVQGGEVVGRVEGVAISGNAFDVLARVQELGSEARWVGSALLPPLLADGIEVGSR